MVDSANQNCRPGSSQYEDFGKDIKCLAENLDNIWRVIENAKATWAQQSLRAVRSRGPVPPKDWDLSSLMEIIGDYYKTLDDCKRLLEENREFRTGKSVAYNMEWNLFLQPKVDNLRKRLESHNSKIMILLKPLEMHLLCEIHHDLAERIDAVHRSVLHLQGLLIQDVEQAIVDQKSATPSLLPIPTEIERRFRDAAEKSYPEIIRPACFPLQAGADALVTHFENSSKEFTPGRFLNERTPTSIQYLNLLKCVWIMGRLQESESLATVPKDSQWPGYITQLKEDLSIECQRFNSLSTQCLRTPDLSDLRNPTDYAIWAEESIAELISPHIETHIEEVLKLPMPSPSETLKREMSVFRIDSTRFRLVESIDDNAATSARRQELKVEIDLKTVHVTPIYATPSSRPKALELLIHSGSTQINPTFKELKHVFRLQHILTGYKVYERYDQTMVDVQYFVSGQSNPTTEHGRIQLWLPKPFDASSAANSPESSDTQSTVVNSNYSIASASQPAKSKIDMRQAPTSGWNSSVSVATNQRSVSNPISPTATTTDFSLPSSLSQLNFNSARAPVTSYGNPKSSIYSRIRSPSIITSTTVTSQRTSNSVRIINTGSGKARLHERPAKPLLVIFLKSRDGQAKLAMVAIQIDDTTIIKRERCKCRTANSKCPVSCIEGTKGPLIAQRWDADQGLASWNLAALGAAQRKELPERRWNDLARVSIKFQSMEGRPPPLITPAKQKFNVLVDRYKFAGGPCSCKPKMQHDLSKCILKRHQGIFGEIRQISSQRLRNYHEERERAGGRSIVLGSLPESES